MNMLWKQMYFALFQTSKLADINLILSLKNVSNYQPLGHDFFILIDLQKK